MTFASFHYIFHNASYLSIEFFIFRQHPFPIEDAVINYFILVKFLLSNNCNCKVICDIL
ncbi:hypothetical protein JN11_04376 [Mucilaginibacter frigoritolerans]|jgi:hypothetical protein|uniref:Uncharacterized protein n=1 Tax=Mucilaginibacter frigoritolerans TaxID=652788 RepID=A0A562TP39_9SPHI|nr:hypothetical protein JN11_04376 [Mucilaginibacter frigoritolerans]